MNHLDVSRVVIQPQGRAGGTPLKAAMNAAGEHQPGVAVARVDQDPPTRAAVAQQAPQAGWGSATGSDPARRSPTCSAPNRSDHPHNGQPPRDSSRHRHTRCSEPDPQERCPPAGATEDRAAGARGHSANADAKRSGPRSAAERWPVAHPPKTPSGHDHTDRADRGP